MRHLADTQALIAAAVSSGNAAALPDSLFRDPNGRGRFGIHIRHFQMSLTRALIQKFPATEWLVGSEFLSRSALKYVFASMPKTPCIADYGEDFPKFLAEDGGIGRWPYVEALARLDWLLGKASIAADGPALGWSEISAIGPEALLDTCLNLQAGTHYLRAAYSVDDIVRSYLADEAQLHSSVVPAETCVEIRGSRGKFSLTRIDSSQFEFRQALVTGLTVGDAACLAMEIKPDFDTGIALRNLLDAGYVSAMERIA